MDDNRKTCLSCAFLAAAAVLPLVSFATGWAVTQEWQAGAYAMLATFGVLVLIAFIIMMTLRRPSALLASLPFALGLLYTLIPNPIPIPIDAVLATLVGSIFSYFLWLKRWPAMPRWLAHPMLACTAFNLVGGFIIGPFDEIIAYTLILAAAAARLLREYLDARSTVPPAAQTPAPDPIPQLQAAPDTITSPQSMAQPPAAAVRVYDALDTPAPSADPFQAHLSEGKSPASENLPLSPPPAFEPDRPSIEEPP
jgi:hypothetical protein